ncbi:MAG TPA: hypothetical protein VNH18_18975 [Bryobacteraceae bacterium]|nr:hypothetical protein [Bryobacteraceae bacterium]
MLVETYEVTEVDGEGTPECEAEAKRLIDALELEGQQSLYAAGETTVRSPYRKMTAQEKFVYSQICPRKMSLKKYDDRPVPVRILQVAAHATPIYDHVYVWCPANADEPDPVLVGMNGADYTSHELFLLARWGEVLEPLSVLAVKAAKIARARMLNELEGWYSAIKAKAEALRALPDDAVHEFKIPTVYGL